MDMDHAPRLPYNTHGESAHTRILDITERRERRAPMAPTAQHLDLHESNCVFALRSSGGEKPKACRDKRRTHSTRLYGFTIHPGGRSD
jgi:hypothetical protein